MTRYLTSVPRIAIYVGAVRGYEVVWFRIFSLRAIPTQYELFMDIQPDKSDHLIHGTHTLLAKSKKDTQRTIKDGETSFQEETDIFTGDSFVRKRE